MEDSWFDFQWPVSSVDDHLISMAAVDHAHDHAYAHAPLFEPSSRPSKHLKAHTGDHLLMNQNLVHGNDCTSQGSLATPKDVAFVSSNGANEFICNNLSSSYSGKQNNYVFSKDFEGGGGGASITSTKNTSRRVAPYQDHILAERKRREKLSEKFIALSALIPNLKKMDKASVLGDAIEYMKTLQEKVKTLEEETSKRANLESRRFEMVANGGEMSSSDENISCFSEQIPEIKARFIGNDVLIRIHCEKKPGVLEKTLAEIEKLRLSVINSNAVIFANSMLHITVVAQMDKDLTMTTKDFVTNLHSGGFLFLVIIMVDFVDLYNNPSCCKEVAIMARVRWGLFVGMFGSEIEMAINMLLKRCAYAARKNIGVHRQTDAGRNGASGGEKFYRVEEPLLVNKPNGNSGGGRSYKDALYGGPISSGVVGNVMELEDIELGLSVSWIGRSLIGQVKSFKAMEDMEKIIGGLQNMKVETRYLGGMKVLLTFSSPDKVKSVMDNREWWSDGFDDIGIWDGHQLGFQRLPDLTSVYVGVVVDHDRKISEEVNLKWKDVIVNYWVSEAVNSWKPRFVTEEVMIPGSDVEDTVITVNDIDDKKSSPVIDLMPGD
ncbi:hypothetical protein M8C21_026854, partial [Ambrosia artemisiifolia]